MVPESQTLWVYLYVESNEPYKLTNKIELDLN